MTIFNFDTTEFTSLIVASIGLLVIIYLYFIKKVKGDKEGLLDLRIIFIIFILVFLNRFFTNIEALYYKEFFNLLEHTSSALAGVTGIILGWKGFKRWSK